MPRGIWRVPEPIRKILRVTSTRPPHAAIGGAKGNAITPRNQTSRFTLPVRDREDAQRRAPLLVTRLKARSWITLSGRRLRTTHRRRTTLATAEVFGVVATHLAVPNEAGSEELGMTAVRLRL